MADTYTVQNGDSWFRIAGNVYGDQRMFNELMKANNGGYALHPGMVINLPGKIDVPNVSEAVMANTLARFPYDTAPPLSSTYSPMTPVANAGPREERSTPLGGGTLNPFGGTNVSRVVGGNGRDERSTPLGGGTQQPFVPVTELGGRGPVSGGRGATPTFPGPTRDERSTSLNGATPTPLVSGRVPGTAAPGFTGYAANFPGVSGRVPGTEAPGMPGIVSPALSGRVPGTTAPGFMGYSANFPGISGRVPGTEAPGMPGNLLQNFWSSLMGAQPPSTEGVTPTVKEIAGTKSGYNERRLVAVPPPDIDWMDIRSGLSEYIPYDYYGGGDGGGGRGGETTDTGEFDPGFYGLVDLRLSTG